MSLDEVFFNLPKSYGSFCTVSFLVKTSNFYFSFKYFKSNIRFVAKGCKDETLVCRCYCIVPYSDYTMLAGASDCRLRHFCFYIPIPDLLLTAYSSPLKKTD